MGNHDDHAAREAGRQFLDHATDGQRRILEPYKVERAWDIPISYPELRAATGRCMPTLVLGLDVATEDHKVKVTEYRLHDRTLGEVGTLLLRASTWSEESLLGQVSPCCPEPRKTTAEEHAEIASIADLQAQAAAWEALVGRIQQEATITFQRRKEKQELAIDTLFSRLARDPVVGARWHAWQKANEPTPTLSPADAKALQDLIDRKIGKVLDLRDSGKDISLAELGKLGLNPALKQALTDLGEAGMAQEIRRAVIRATVTAGYGFVDTAEPMGPRRKTAVRREAASNRPRADSNKPWLRVPDVGWHRQALELWWTGYTIPEIAKKISFDGKTIRNMFSLLRKQFGHEVVPTAEELRKLKRR